VSSSRIRRLIASGQLSRARALLGYAPTLYGIVERGTGRGRRLGMPTANLRLDSRVLPPQGVYAVILRDVAAHRSWRGVMNLGVRPTFGPGPLVCEVHLLGFPGRLLGRSVAVSLLARLRGERCFPSPAALTRQVERDVRRARRLFQLRRPAAS
jgi:riboflavin kinase/FMN adenylyltransferase